MANKSYFDPDIAVSLEMPADWEAAATEHFPLLLMAPSEQAFRANLSFSVETLDPPTPANLQLMIDQTRADRRQTFEGFQLVSEQRMMQDNFPAHIEYYHWNMDGSHIPMTQLFALILTAPDALYGLHGTCLQSTEDTYLPIFTAIIRSLRFIPSKG